MGTMARSIRCAFASAHNAPSPPAIGLLPIIVGSEPLVRPAFLAGLETAVMAEHHHFSPRGRSTSAKRKAFILEFVLTKRPAQSGLESARGETA
jgi:hypothetical protein